MGPAFGIVTICDFGSGQVFNESAVQTTLTGVQCGYTDVGYNITSVAGGVVRLYVSELPKGCTYIATLSLAVSDVVLAV